MCKRRFKKESLRKRFFRPNNRLLRMASSVINKLDGTNEEKLGQFEMIVNSEAFKKRFPGLIGEDVATIVRAELFEY